MCHMFSDMHRLALVMHDTAMLYEVAIAAEVLDSSRYDFVVATADGAPHPWLAGKPTTSYDALTDADTVVVPSTEDLEGEPDDRLVTALGDAHRNGARIASLCTGSFVLAAAGLLNGRTATTHWMHADALALRFPAVRVRADVLFTEDGELFTSAGKTAALDLCLHLIRTDFGAAEANRAAKRLVVPSVRPGGQAQFIAPPKLPAESAGLAPTLHWAREHLGEELSVTDLARRAGLSSRQLTRRMQTELQATPLEWLHRQRVTRAQELLETSNASMEQIAARCGLSNAAVMRRHFTRALGVTPTAYRTSFAAPRAERHTGAVPLDV